MNYLKINLNKLDDPRVARKKARREVLAYIVISAIAVALFSNLCLQATKLNQKLGQFKEVKEKIEAELKILEQRDDYVSEAEVRELSRLNRKRVFWTGKLEELTRLTGNSIAITRIKLKGNQLLIAGITKSSRKNNHFNDVSDFIKNLQATPEFKRDYQNIVFESSNRMMFDKQEIILFEILCHRGDLG